MNSPLLDPNETWVVSSDGTRVITHSKHDEEPWGDDEVCRLESTAHCQFDFDRAPLIAAAPEMYRLLTKLYVDLDVPVGYRSESYTLLRWIHKRVSNGR